MRLFSALFNRQVKSGLRYFLMSTLEYDIKKTTPFIRSGHATLEEAQAALNDLGKIDYYVIVRVDSDRGMTKIITL